MRRGRGRPLAVGAIQPDHLAMKATLIAALAAWMGSVSVVYAQDEPAPAKPSDGQTATPSDFARFVAVEEGGHFDTAITTACSYLDFIVVETIANGEECIQYLRDNKVGRASFICLEKVS